MYFEIMNIEYRIYFKNISIFFQRGNEKYVYKYKLYGNMVNIIKCNFT